MAMARIAGLERADATQDCPKWGHLRRQLRERGQRDQDAPVGRRGQREGMQRPCVGSAISERSQTTASGEGMGAHVHAGRTHERPTPCGGGRQCAMGQAGPAVLARRVDKRDRLTPAGDRWISGRRNLSAGAADGKAGRRRSLQGMRHLAPAAGIAARGPLDHKIARASPRRARGHAARVA